MFKILIIIFSIILFLLGNAWLYKNQNDLTKGTEDFCAIAIMLSATIMFLLGVFII